MAVPPNPSPPQKPPAQTPFGRGWVLLGLVGLCAAGFIVLYGLGGSDQAQSSEEVPVVSTDQTPPETPNIIKESSGALPEPPPTATLGTSPPPSPSAATLPVPPTNSNPPAPPSPGALAMREAQGRADHWQRTHRSLAHLPRHVWEQRMAERVPPPVPLPEGATGDPGLASFSAGPPSRPGYSGHPAPEQRPAHPSPSPTPRTSAAGVPWPRF